MQVMCLLRFCRGLLSRVLKTWVKCCLCRLFYENIDCPSIIYMRYFTYVQNLLINVAKDPVFYPGTEGLVACSWVFCCFVLEFNKRYFEDPPRGRCLHKYADTLSLYAGMLGPLLNCCLWIWILGIRWKTIGLATHSIDNVGSICMYLQC